MNRKLKKAITLRTERKFEEAEYLFKELVRELPKNGSIFYNYAWLYDNMEREKEAIPLYEKAIEFGLNRDELKGCYLGLGSSYRCIGEYSKSLLLFDKALIDFPDNKEYIVFKAMAFYNANEHHEAMNLLLNVISETSKDSGIQEYKEAITFYAQNLDRKIE